MDKNLEGEFVLQSDKPTTHPSKNTIRFFSHCVKNPANLRISEQKEDEKVHLVLRSHFITNLPWALLVFILLLLPLIILPITFATLSFIAISRFTIGMVVAFYYLIVFGYALVNFCLWYFQTTFVTTHRVIDIDLQGILGRNVNEAPLDAVLEVGYNQVGLFASLLDYGDIQLETETRIQNLEVIKAPHPAKTVRMISDLLEKARES